MERSGVLGGAVPDFHIARGSARVLTAPVLLGAAGRTFFWPRQRPNIPPRHSPRRGAAFPRAAQRRAASPRHSPRRIPPAHSPCAFPPTGKHVARPPQRRGALTRVLGTTARSWRSPECTRMGLEGSEFTIMGTVSPSVSIRVNPCPSRLKCQDLDRISESSIKYPKNQRQSQQPRSTMWDKSLT